MHLYMPAPYIYIDIGGSRGVPWNPSLKVDNIISISTTSNASFDDGISNIVTYKKNSRKDIGVIREIGKRTSLLVQSAEVRQLGC